MRGEGEESGGVFLAAAFFGTFFLPTATLGPQLPSVSSLRTDWDTRAKLRMKPMQRTVVLRTYGFV